MRTRETTERRNAGLLRFCRISKAYCKLRTLEIEARLAQQSRRQSQVSPLQHLRVCQKCVVLFLGGSSSGYEDERIYGTALLTDQKSNEAVCLPETIGPSACIDLS
jgi:hypothetical protein